MPHWMPSLNALRAFEAVARKRSYRKAADELGVTPAAVKQLVSKLEASVAAELVQRKGRGLELTPRGMRGLEDLSAAMALLAMSVRKLRRDDDPANRLVVSVEASFASAWLVPKLEGFRARHPEVTVLVDSNQSVVDIGRGDIDVGIRYGVKSPDNLFVHRLFADEIFPVCSPALADGPPKLATLADLRTLTLIHRDISQLSWASSTRRWFTWQSWLNAVGAPHLLTQQGLIFSEYGQAVQAAIVGQGVLLASWPILREPVEAGVLVAPFSERVTTDIGYEIVVSPEMMARPEVAAFVAWVIETASL